MAFALLLWISTLSKNGPYAKLSYKSRFDFTDWHITHQLIKKPFLFLVCSKGKEKCISGR